MTIPALLAAHPHGIAGADFWTWLIWAAVCAVSVWAIWAAVRATFRPGETDRSHVKYSILDDDVGPARAAPPPGPPAPGGRLG